jgi:protein CLEC16A
MNKIESNFIEEIEKNSKIFEEKINKLNSTYDSENSFERKDSKKYKFTKKNNLYNQKNYETENNFEENYYQTGKINTEKRRNKKMIKRYELNLNTIDNINERNKNNNKNFIYNNTTGNSNNRRKIIYNNELNDEDIIENNNEKKLIDELRQTILQKSNFIKLLKSELKEKEKLPSKEDYDELNYNYENILNELNLAQNTIKDKDDEINNLKMKLDSILAQNKNMKNVISKKEVELDKMKSTMNSMKDELKLNNNKMNDIMINEKQMKKDYDILNQKYNSIVSEKEKLLTNLEEQKTENFNNKKENIQLQKLIDKLKEELNKANSSNNNSSNKNKEKTIQIEYKNYERNKINEPKEIIKNHTNKITTKPKIINISKKLEKKILDSDETTFAYKNKIKERYEDTEEKIIYNNDDDESDEEDESNKEKINKQKTMMQNDKYVKKNLENIFNSKNENHIKKKKIEIDKDKNKEFVSLIKYKDKIIGCNRDKIKSLIKDKEYQIIEKELNILNKEKEKIENELLKMPEHPRKLNDIKNKNEINDAINKIDNDIKYIRTLLKNTDDYYIN